MTNPNIKTIGIKVAAYNIIKAVSESRKNTTKPDGICDIATEAIEKAFGDEYAIKKENVQPETLNQAG